MATRSRAHERENESKSREESSEASREAARESADETSRDTPSDETGDHVETKDEAPASDAGEGASQGDDALERLASRLEEAKTEAARQKEEKEQLYDRWLRLQAEFDNFRRRTRREMDELRVQAAEDLVAKLLPVVDNFERALASAKEADGAHKALLDGVEMVYKQFFNVLQQVGLKPIDPVGEAFDPTLHEAVLQEETDAYPDGHVMEELQRGYYLNDKVLRPSMVKVARGAGAKEGDEDE